MGKLILESGNIVSDEFLAPADAIVLPTNPMMRCGAGVIAYRCVFRFV